MIKTEFRSISSKKLPLFFIALHLLALFSLLYSNPPLLIYILSICYIVFSGFMSYKNSHSTFLLNFSFSPRPDWLIVSKYISLSEMNLLSASIITPFVCIFCFKSAETNSRLILFLPSWLFKKKEFKQLLAISRC
jgi:hypothetical protein